MKKNEIIKVSLLLVIPVIVFTYTLLVMPGDELYNFQSVCKMVNGYKIYQDFNVIITPLFFGIASLFQKLFGNYIIVFRFYGVLIGYLMYFAFYKLLIKFGVNEKVRITGLIAFILATLTIVYNGANYNTLAIALLLIGIMLAIDKPSVKNNILIGIMAYLIFMTKQNVGVLYALGIFICQVLLYKKDSIKSLITEFLVGFWLCCITVIILSVMGIFPAFINYVFMGITNFANKNFTATVEFYALLTYVIIGIGVNVLFLLYAIKTKRKDYYIVFVMGILLYFTVFPIINLYHLIMAEVLTIFEAVILFDLLYNSICIDEKYEERAKKNKLFSINKFLIVMNVFFYLIVVAVVVLQVYKAQQLMINLDKDSPYKYSLMVGPRYEEINTICDYIKEKQNEGKIVIVFSEEACLYTPVLGLNNGDLDLPFYGNLGKEGEEGLINKISSLKNTIFLLDTDSFWQLAKDAKMYIIQNYNKTGSIVEYNIFEKIYSQ